MKPPTFSKPKPFKSEKEKNAHEYKTVYSTRITGKRTDQAPVEPRVNDPFSGIKPAAAWISCKQDAAEVAKILNKKEAANV